MKKTSCNIRDLAKYVNVSPGTVSRVLNGRQSNVSITEETRCKILAAAKELNYTPNINAKRLFSHRSGIIGLAVPSYTKMRTHIFEDMHLTRMISGLEYGFENNDYNLLLLFCNEKFIEQKKQLALFKEKSIDGLIVWGAYINDNIWMELSTSPYPHLFMGNSPAPTKKLARVAPDYRQAGYMAAEYILNKGRKNLAWIGSNIDISLNEEHLAGIYQAMEERGLSGSDIKRYQSPYIMHEGAVLSSKILEDYPAVDGIICTSVEIAAGAAMNLKEKKIDIPGQISVMSCHCINSNEYLTWVSSVLVDDYETGKVAANEIISMIEGQKAPNSRYTKPTLREGCTA